MRQGLTPRIEIASDEAVPAYALVARNSGLAVAGSGSIVGCSRFPSCHSERVCRCQSRLACVPVLMRVPALRAFLCERESIRMPVHWV